MPRLCLIHPLIRKHDQIKKYQYRVQTYAEFEKALLHIQIDQHVIEPEEGGDDRRDMEQARGLEENHVALDDSIVA